VTSWRFVGRAKELGLFAAAVTTATDAPAEPGPRGRGLVVSGAKGVGKTRLLREAVATLDPERVAVWTAYATAATAELPLGSLAHELPPEHPSGMSPAGQLRWAVDMARQQAGGRPIVFALDDIHLLDSLSVALVHLLAHGGDTVVLGTHRDGEPVHDSVSALWKDDLVDRIDLDSLSRAETAELVGQVLGGVVDPASVDRLHRLSQGNPQLLRELVLGAQTHGDFTEAYGLWRWTGRPYLAAGLVQAIDARIGHLDDDVRTVVELVALGEPLELRLVATAANPAAVELAEERGLIRVDQHDRRLSVRLAHPLYGEVIRHRCPVTRTHRLLANLAEMVERTGARRRHDRLRIAVWRLDSQAIQDPAALLAAGRQALADCDLPLAGRLASAARDCGGDRDAGELLALSLLLADRAAEASKALETVRDSQPTTDGLGSWHATRALVSYWGLQDERAISELAMTIPTLARAEDKSAVAAFESVLRLQHHETPEAVRLASTVLRCPSASASSRALAGSTVAYGESLSGATARAARTIAAIEADAAAWRGQSPAIQLAVDMARGGGLLLAGDLDRIAALNLDEAAARYESGEFRLGAGYHAILLGQAARMRGRLADAGRLSRKACAILGPNRLLAGLAHAERAHAAALAGSGQAASAALREADRLHHSSMAILYPWLEHARYWVRMSLGDPDAAAAMAKELAARLRTDGFGAHEAIALHDVVRLGRPEDVADRLAVLARESEGTLITTMARHAKAAVDRDAGGLLAAAEGFGALGMSLHAAEAAAAALNRLRQTRSTRIGEAAKLFATLIARCEEPRTPGLVVSRPSLSAREYQVARVAAAGFTSKEIADQLYLSTRTVDNHLRRVYAKLGVAGRGELTSALATLNGDAPELAARFDRGDRLERSDRLGRPAEPGRR
jgi:DNA-binding CsgD family transcriptional regulator